MPSAGLGIVCEQALVIQRLNELRGEERIAAGLFVHQTCQWASTSAFARQRFSDQGRYVEGLQRLKLDLDDRDICAANCLQLRHERMKSADFVAAVSTDQHQIWHVPMGDEIAQQ